MKTLATIAFALSLSSTAFAETLTLDASGRSGTKGRDGSPGFGAGADGQDASRAQPGSSAGAINIRLSGDGRGGVEITGTHHRTYSIGSSGQIILRAVGGRGGDGGNGGEGAAGSRGMDGSRATRTSSGTNGGDGGPGGDGGDGSSGAYGGDGGTITVTVKEKDMNLLYLLATPDVSGGEGGKRGNNGRGGQGGSGGSGGGSYSWEVTYNGTCTRSDTNGKGQAVMVTYSCPKTRTESNPGGADGLSGRSGRNGQASLSDGARGKSGSYSYVVEYDNGAVGTYPSAFDLVVTDFALASDFSDTFLQPGERISLSRITLANRGGMPSPTLTPIRFHADADVAGTLSAGGAPVDLKTSLPPGGSVTITDRKLLASIASRFFELNPPEWGKHLGGPKQAVTFGVRGEVVGIGRDLKRFTAIHGMAVRYPIALSRLDGKRTIAQGDDYLFKWAVENYSRAEMGGEAGNRRIRVTSAFAYDKGSSSKPRSLYLKANNSSSSEEGKGIQSVGRVGPRDSAGEPTEGRVMAADLGFTEDAKQLERATLKVTVEIEDPYVRDQWAVADVATFDVKVGMAFKPAPGSDGLLVTNPETTPEELNAWVSLLASTGRKFDVWDIGVMGALDLTKNDLGQHYAGGTILILNDLIQMPGTEKVPADAMFKLSPTFLNEQAALHHIGLFVMDRTNSYSALSGGQDHMANWRSDDPMLVAVKASAKQFKDPAFIQSHATKLALCLAAPFERKLARLKRLLSLPESVGEDMLLAYSEAVFYDLAIEWVRAQEEGSAQLPFLSLLTRSDLLQLDGKIPASFETPGARALIDTLARYWFLVTSGEEEAWDAKPGSGVASLSVKMLTEYSGRLVKGPRKPLERAINKRTAELYARAAKIEGEFVGADDSRYFKFPRKWRGSYYRQAVLTVTLKFLYDRVYTNRLQLFRTVMEDARLAVPNFN